ncbi:uncharacterized protein PITG_16628 [Phytophthora infestans T30-4]|uniref:Uncharacterized protein n=1 Tax=Phytophthora infestans (strain T30-4) TaxID=403677 RepID=D0NUT7_PHYIT|nr:uncharacterized protein PITG_16628 [Phytophthora infestans T30-4]EEY65448.1 hypothetical protein PITG_16628 [Phytophthora infestans T30-4]|eukprot:XP_002897166.1 hypothetical protein PITG_16628 [Phytophthora infestans T30-4]
MSQACHDVLVQQVGQERTRHDAGYSVISGRWKRLGKISPSGCSPKPELEVSSSSDCRVTAAQMYNWEIDVNTVDKNGKLLSKLG